jgi:cell division septation protein DedD
VAAQAAASAPAAAAKAPVTTGIFMINVGLFANPNNARKAYTQLKDAGLPALSQELKPVQGKPRTRVRAGPFDTQAEADSAAERIRALKLDAAVFKP